MPLPRKSRPKRLAKGSRSSRRRVHAKTWLMAKIEERFDRFAELAELKRQQEQAAGDYGRPVQEKTPGLAAEGFSSCFEEKER